jgi:polar amino acid transport system substrate-binding protein
MKKIAGGLMLSILLVIIMAGCGKQSAPASQGSSAAPATSPSAAAPAATSTAASTAAKGTLDKMKEKGVMIVGSSNDTPFAYIDKDSKKFVGIDAEILQEIAKRLGIAKVEMKEIKFENLLLELNNKNVDIVADGMYVKPEREKIASFTTPWYKEGEGLIVLKDSKIKGVEDLKDKVLGGQKGTAFLEYVQQLKTEGKIKDVKIFGSQAELLLATNTKKIDAAITDSATAAYTITNDPSLSIRLVAPYTAHYSGIIAAAVRQDDKEFLTAVNTELDKLKQEGFVLTVLKKYGLNEDNMVSVK